MSSPPAFDLPAAPLPMLDLLLPMVKSAALIAAGQLGLFAGLAAGPLPLAELAQKLAVSVDGLQRLADVLVSVGYLDCDGDIYRNQPVAQTWFSGAGPIDYSAGLTWSGNAWLLLHDLAQCVRDGGPAQSLWQLMEQRPSWGPDFSGYMHAFAQHLGPDLLTHVPVAAGQRRLLDLGGSHGQHSLAFCRQYPQLEAVIVDQPSALSQTAATVEAAGLTQRVSLRAGDLRLLSWGEGYDVVLFLAVMHNQSPQDSQASIARIAAALAPGGVLVIHEYPLDRPLPPFEAAFALTLLSETGTKPPTSADLFRWLAEAGLPPPQVIPLSPREKGTLFLCTKPLAVVAN